MNELILRTTLGTKKHSRKKSKKESQNDNDYIHVLRHDMEEIANSTKPQSVLIPNYYENRINVILKTVSDIKHNLQNGNHVLIYCHNGWDMTPQLTSLTMLHMDAHYRTLIGFVDLIEKEWISFGHQFGKRYASYSNTHHGELSPVFLQFLHCVSICIERHETDFEFNEKLLLFIAKHVYSLHYYNFIFGNERHRYVAKSILSSIWDDVFMIDKGEVVVLGDYKNDRFSKRSCRNEDIPVVLVENTSKISKMWEGYY